MIVLIIVTKFFEMGVIAIGYSSTQSSVVSTDFSNISTSSSSTTSLSIASNLTSSNDSSQFITISSTFSRDGYNKVFDYEAIQATVFTSGTYSFTSISSVDMYGYLYINNFDPLNTSNNYLQEHDDDDAGLGQFSIQYALQPNITNSLVATN